MENQKNQLFLYKLFDNGVKRVESIVSWFENVMVIYPQSKFRRLPIRVQTDEELKEFLSETLSKLDTGVFKISASTKQMSLSDFVKKEEVPEKIVEEIESKEGGIINISGSKIKPLSDFDIKKGQNMLKDYINGRFGAVPVIRSDENAFIE